MRWLFVLALVASVLAADYYKVLGVDRDASDKELKKAYRSLSRQHHPDKNRGDEASAKKFIEISEAYEILSDPEKRQLFDKYGEAGLNGQAQGGFGMHQDPMDLFQRFFGGAGGFHQQQNSVRKGHSTMTVLHASLADMYNGEKVEMGLRMRGICEDCEGSGSADGHRDTCKVCQGRGQRILRHQIAPGMVQTMQTICDACGGKGTTISHPCPSCRGEGVVEEDRKYNIFLEPHQETQWDYVLEGEGDQSPDWVPGDLVVRITQSPDDNFGYRRRGFHLFREEVLSAKEAQAGGWKRVLSRLDQSTTVEIGRGKGERVYNNQVEKLTGEGMPRNEDGDHGDLYITYKVVGDVVPRDEHDEL